MNCEKAPFNWTAFRRAFAMAFDKTRVQTELFESLSQLHDSLVPATKVLFCIEEDFPYHYYNDEATQGNLLLNQSGFGFDPVTGYRTDPNGNPIDIEIAFSPSSVAIAGGTAQIGVDALRALHFQANTNQADFNTYLANLNTHGDYDMVFFATSFTGSDVDYLDRMFGSVYADQDYQNRANFRNETVDGLLADLINAKDYAAAYAASAEVQLALQYEVPVLITYENFYF
jgi:ABC-type transport system substrate-binding protein